MCTTIVFLITKKIRPRIVKFLFDYLTNIKTRVKALSSPNKCNSIISNKPVLTSSKKNELIKQVLICYLNSSKL